MDYEVSVDIDATPGEVWNVLTNVERWPEWTSSMTRVERLDTGPLQVGSTARIEQPKLPSVVWRVTELEPERSFSWVASRGGVTMLAGHRITRDGRTMDPKAQIVGEFVKSIRVPGYFPPLPELRQQLRTMVHLLDEPA